MQCFQNYYVVTIKIRFHFESMQIGRINLYLQYINLASHTRETNLTTSLDKLPLPRVFNHCAISTLLHHHINSGKFILGETVSIVQVISFPASKSLIMKTNVSQIVKEALNNFVDNY
jgi:hypothetical protein